MTEHSESAQGNSSEAIVMAFIQCFNDNRIADAVAMLADDVFYQNMPDQPIHGRDAVAAFFAAVDLGGALTSEWIVHAVAASGDVVLTERVDKFFSPNGNEASVPMMGSFRVKDGMIAEWRDYYDSAIFLQQMALLA